MKSLILYQQPNYASNNKFINTSLNRVGKNKKFVDCCKESFTIRLPSLSATQNYSYYSNFPLNFRLSLIPVPFTRKN